MAESKSAALPLGYAPKRAGPYLRKRDRSIAAIFVSPLVRATSRSHPATSIAQRRRRLPRWKARRCLPVLSTARKTRFELFGAVPRQKMGETSPRWHSASARERSCRLRRHCPVRCIGAKLPKRSFNNLIYYHITIRCCGRNVHPAGAMRLRPSQPRHDQRPAAITHDFPVSHFGLGSTILRSNCCGIDSASQRQSDIQLSRLADAY
jgi:hypothetical protein